MKTIFIVTGIIALLCGVFYKKSDAGLNNILSKYTKVNVVSSAADSVCYETCPPACPAKKSHENYN
jgi:hypothetical protein